MKVLEIVRTAALVLLAVAAAWITTHGVVLEIHHTGLVGVTCPVGGICPGVPMP